LTSFGSFLVKNSCFKGLFDKVLRISCQKPCFKGLFDKVLRIAYQKAGLKKAVLYKISDKHKKGTSSLEIPYIFAITASYFL